jgi:hypothetical protein
MGVGIEFGFASLHTTALDFSCKDCLLEPEDCVFMAMLLRTNLHLTALDLSNSNLQPEGLLHLGYMLGVGGNTTLTSLRAASCRVAALGHDLRGVEAVANGLQGNGKSALRVLDLSHNFIGRVDRTWQQVLEQLWKNKEEEEEEEEERKRGDKLDSGGGRKVCWELGV